MREISSHPLLAVYAVRGALQPVITLDDWHEQNRQKSCTALHDVIAVPGRPVLLFREEKDLRVKRLVLW